MIILLAAGYDDARRWDDEAQLDDEAILIAEARDVEAHARIITPGARIVRTDGWLYDDRIVSALRTLALRVPLADPTGLLGPLDPDRRRPATSGPTRQYNDPPGGVRKGRGGL